MKRNIENKRNKGRKMKNDRYLKFILTIIAICLIWICIRDITIGRSNVYAESYNSGQTEVELSYIYSSAKSAIQDAVWNAIQLSLPIQVEMYSPNPEEE